MGSENLFTSLSAYRQATRATPFENYCTSALAYFLQSGEPNVCALFTAATGREGEAVIAAVPQRELAPGVITDLVVEMQSSRPIVVDVEVDAPEEGAHLPELEAIARVWDPGSAFIVVRLSDRPARPGWAAITWAQIADAIRASPERLALEFSEFIDRDILGRGAVELSEALTTNRLYALGAACVRRRFGTDVTYVNSSSRPMGGQYRYLGTTFSTPGAEMSHWIGIVNETIPLGEHYVLMLASKTGGVTAPVQHPRATAEWKWPAWTGAGRVVRPLTAEAFDELLGRLET